MNPRAANPRKTAAKQRAVRSAGGETRKAKSARLARPVAQPFCANQRRPFQDTACDRVNVDLWPANRMRSSVSMVAEFGAAARRPV